jgi:glycine dehydrogenase subunit 2
MRQLDTLEPGQPDVFLNPLDVDETRHTLPDRLLRTSLDLPSLSLDTVRKEFDYRESVNTNANNAFFPLGSCTMIKTPYGVIMAPTEFVDLHPRQPVETSQGMLHLMHDLEGILTEMMGGEGWQGTLHPSAGAHSELTSLFMIEAYHRSRGEGEQRRIVLTPDSAHGTNPASAAMAGYDVMEAPSDKKTGRLDIKALESILEEHGNAVAAFMITHPSTYGIYDEQIKDITEMLHSYGIKVYCDGANFVALTGRVKFSDLGIDIVHSNLHKTFGVPHGGGGPGAGFVAAEPELVPFLPNPRIVKESGEFKLSYDNLKSIGMVASPYGPALAHTMAMAYIRQVGSDGFRKASALSVLTGNYMNKLLSELTDDEGNQLFPEAFPGLVMHEGIVTDKYISNIRVNIDGKSKPLTLGLLVKAIINESTYAPTMGFPRPDGILTEPTYNASVAEMETFANELRAAVGKIQNNPDFLTQFYAPTSIPLIQGTELEARANRQPILT